MDTENRGTTHFAASVVTQVGPVHFKLAMVVHVYQLVNERVFHVTLAEEPTGAQDDGASLGTEASRACVITGSTKNVRWCDWTA